MWTRSPRAVVVFAEFRAVACAGRLYWFERWERRWVGRLLAGELIPADQLPESLRLRNDAWGPLIRVDRHGLARISGTAGVGPTDQ